MRVISTCEEVGAVTFPDYQGERVYMRQFTKSGGLPSDLSRWQQTVDEMLRGVEANGPIFLMVDQAYVSNGATHRRGGLHIDGAWTGTGWNVPPKWNTTGHGHSIEGPLKDDIILASNVSACRGYVGEYDSNCISTGGDASAVDVLQLNEVKLASGVAYIGNFHFLHESLAVNSACYRTVVRLNVRVKSVV